MIYLSKNILFMIISKSKRNQMKCLKTRYIKFAQLTSNQQDVSFGPSCFFNRKTIFGCCFACPSEESPRNHWTLCRGRIRCSKQGKKKKISIYGLFIIRLSNWKIYCCEGIKSWKSGRRASCIQRCLEEKYFFWCIFGQSNCSPIRKNSTGNLHSK